MKDFTAFGSWQNQYQHIIPALFGFGPQSSSKVRQEAVLSLADPNWKMTWAHLNPQTKIYLQLSGRQSNCAAKQQKFIRIPVETYVYAIQTEIVDMYCHSQCVQWCNT
jgi:hypothetical protein